MGNLNRYTVQCVLVANFINDKIFLLLHIWIAIISLSTFGSLTFWLFNSLSFVQRYNFVGKFVHEDILKRRKSAQTILFEKFVASYLQKDGVFILRMISTHAGDVITMEVVEQLWEDFVKNRTETINETDKRHSNGNEKNKCAVEFFRSSFHK